MSVPIPPPDFRNQAPPLRRHLVSLLPLAIWPVGAFALLFGSAAGEESPLGRGFTALTEAPWWAAIGAAMALVTATLLSAASLRLAADFTIGASALALMTAWAVDPAAAQVVGTPLWGCLLFSIGIALIDAGHNLQERRARRPPQGGNGV